MNDDQQTIKKPMMFLKSIYFKTEYMRDRNNRPVMANPDSISIVYKNERTDKKYIMNIENPTIEYFLYNGNDELPHPVSFMKTSHVETQKVLYRDLIKTLAESVGALPNYYEKIKARKNFELNEYHQNRYIFSSDIDIEDYYKKKWLEKYEPRNIINKGFYDIEVDNRNHLGFPEEDEAPCPVNAITYIDAKTKSSKTYILRDIDNPLNVDLELNRQDELRNDLIQNLSNELTYIFQWFDDELELLTQFFNDINEYYEPDYCLAWNARFDLLTMMNRMLLKYGVDPVEIVCDKRFPENRRICYFKKDIKHPKYSDRNDTFNVSSLISFQDAAQIFASLRKGLGERESYKLNDIAMEELGEGKLDYSEAGDLKSLIDLDFYKFIYYNIKDVYLLWKLEEKNNDVDLLHLISDTTHTRIEKTMRKTISLKNFAYSFYQQQGYVMSNNFNMQYNNDIKTGETEQFEGAIVLDPFNIASEGIKHLGRISNRIFCWNCDFDYSSLYPSIVLCNNMDSSTIKYKIYFDQESLKKIHLENDEKPAGRFLDRYTSKNLTQLCTDYFNLPTIEQVLEMI